MNSLNHAAIPHITRGTCTSPYYPTRFRCMKQFVVVQPMAFEKVMGPRIPCTTVRDSLHIQVCDDVVERLVGQTRCGIPLERRYEFFLEVAWRDTISLMYLEVHQTSLVIPDDTNKTIVDFFGFAECLANDDEREARQNSPFNREPAVLRLTGSETVVRQVRVLGSGLGAKLGALFSCQVQCAKNFR